MPKSTLRHSDSELEAFPPLRLRLACDRPPRADGQFVVYWMTAARRLRWNWALQRAVDWAEHLRRPLLVVEVLACGGRWDSERHHRFVVQGMADNAKKLAETSAVYYPYVERKPGQGRELFNAVGRRACLVVTDDFPITHPTAATVDASAAFRVEKIDANGLLPIRAADRAFTTAHAFRRFLQRNLPDHLLDGPRPNPLARSALPQLDRLPPDLARRWPAASSEMLSGESASLARLPIDHRVFPVNLVGGPTAALGRWRKFLTKKLASYAQDRNQPEAETTSGLAPYLHCGHISAHEIFHDLARHEGWSPDRLAGRAGGSREGWWGMSQPAEAFLDQLVTWREIGLNACAFQPNFDRFASLPDWAKATLAKHAKDRRPYRYTLDQFAAAQTHDHLWNAAQRQLTNEGTIHNYLRMLWGKKILEWTASPQEALEVMIELNNRYALDGQDPNSYSGIFWVLGRYDRPWGPERPIFGTVRYMSSTNTARKVRVNGYLERYAAGSA